MYARRNRRWRSPALESVGLISAKDVKSRPDADKFRFLINIAELENLHKDYTFSLALSNLVIDRSLRPYVLERDLNCGGASFVDKYMATIGEVITPKYKYDDYINGGADLYKKHKLLEELVDLETVAEIKKRLENEYDETVAEIAATKKLVSKRGVIVSYVLIPVLAAALLGASFFAVRSVIFDIPHQEQIIIASQAYIAGEYIAAQEALRGVSLEDMSFETRHFLARAYVITEAMTDEQKDRTLMGLTRMADGILFDFWIRLGRLEFDEAVDIAHNTMSPDLLMFAYMKKHAFLEGGAAIPGEGEARAAELERLAREIGRLRAELEVEDEVEEDE
ncbi:MAG: hypothetical protein FWD05_05855 [Oscillospiraceae bacterium]|nr:hypothetical protein [Oscillospiraceae bacterium]